MTDKPKQLTGKEEFRNAAGLKLTMGDYWQWAYSDILNNTDRGVLAEYLVCRALGDEAKKMQAWYEYDIKYKGIGVEVKCTAYWQVWDLQVEEQCGVSPKLTDPDPFGIAKHKRSELTSDGGWKHTDDKERWADVYVFCLFAEENLGKIEESILDLSKWEFWVVSKNFLDNQLGDQKKAALSTIEKLAEKVDYGGIKDAVDRAIG